MVTSYIESRREIHANCTHFPKTSEWLHCSLEGPEVAISILRISLFLPFLPWRRKCPLNKSLPRELSGATEHVQWLSPKSLHSSFYGAFIIPQNVGELQYIVISREETGSKIRSGRFHMTAPLLWLLMCLTFGKCPQSCLGNVQSGHTIMTMQQSSHAKSLGPVNPARQERSGTME